MQLIATRRYPIDDLRTGVEHTATDAVYRKGARFYLRETTNGHPSEPDTIRRVSLGYVYTWLSEMPEQIERAVVLGGL
jgi:hypothetical protein